MSVAELSLRDARPLTRGYGERSISSVDIDPAYEETRFRLIFLSFHFRQMGKISSETLTSAIRVLSVLPPDRKLPKIAPDGEDGLVFVWELGSAHTLLTVADQELWPVSQAATVNAHHGKPFSAFYGDLRRKLISFVPGR